MADTQTTESFTYRIRRDAGSLWARMRELWRGNKWVRRFGLLAAFGLLLFGIFWVWLAHDLPDADSLADYETSLPTMVRGTDGEIVGTFARERRVQLEYVDIPRPLINSFLAVEDEGFWSHGGVDYTGTINALFDYIAKMGSGDRAVGGSTITQQLAKNILLGDEYSITRKLKEMILARRIEGVLSKQEIITLYLNEIPLGRRSFGVQSAARAYFDKDVAELDLHEMAFLAILPKAPERYGRKANEQLAVSRRNFVLDAMVDNDYATPEAAAEAKRKPLGLVQGAKSQYAAADAGYFMEEVRRQLIEQFGETSEAGPNSVYGGGLWVRTSLDTELQKAARDSLRAGMMRYHRGKGWKGPIATVDVGAGNLTGQLASSNLAIAYEDWRVGVVTQRSGGSATIGFANGEEASLANLPNALKAGDIVAASPSGNGWRVETVPEVSGGFAAIAPATGRVLAMQGGFDSRLGSFNRATQAQRQPGSTIKPFVYSTGLDQGLTPASAVMDGTFCVYQGSQLGQKCFRNFGGASGAGEKPMRWGLEQSRNLMTVHIANDAGMENVNKTFQRVGIGSYEPYLSFALGAGDTTVLKMVNGYAALANHGRQYDPTVIDYVQDRRGKVIWRADKRRCEGCKMDSWDGKPMPRLDRGGKQVMDARTAFQTLHMLTGVVQRGTATVLRDLDIPLFGKTGTTTGPTNVWFVGGSPDVVAGVYLGFDQPRNMGGYAQGGSLAAPIFKQFVSDSRDRWSGRPFVAPKGVRMVRIDRRTGRRVFDGTPSDDPKSAIIWEAFKPDTEPRRQARADELDSLRQTILAELRAANTTPRQRVRQERKEEEELMDFVESQGGIY